MPVDQPAPERLGLPRRLSRRSLVAASAAALSGGPLVRYGDSRAMAQGAWDEVVDIVVVGSGAAGLTASLIAASLGNTVMVLEKAPSVGGTTARSDRGYWIPDNPWQQEHGLEDSPGFALDYMARVAYPELYDPAGDRLGLPEPAYDLLAAYVDNAASAVAELARLGVRSAVALDRNGEPYPDHFPDLQGPHPAFGRSLVALDADGNPAAGAELVRQLRLASETHGVEIRTGYQVERVVLNDGSEVIGLEAVPGAIADGTPEPGDGGAIAIGARKAVVFASGGFTHNLDLILSFQDSPIFGGYAVPTNQGDVVRIAGAIGAKLGHMKAAFRAQVIVDQALASRSVPRDVFAIPGDGFIIVNKFGDRVVNEKSPYDLRAETHGCRDATRGDWKHLILFLLYDTRQAEQFAGLHPFPAPGADVDYVLTGETWEELRAGIELRLAAIADRTGGFVLDDDFDERLQDTIERFGRFADSGEDRDFGRGGSLHDVTWATIAPPQQQLANGETWPATDQRNVTMRALADTGPYHAIMLGAGTLDTSGGPVINARGQIVDPWDEPIPGLYGAGNCVASPCAGADFGGGTALGVAITFGYIAARHAHQELPRES